jgi:hypothetical protein
MGIARNEQNGEGIRTGTTPDGKTTDSIRVHREFDSSDIDEGVLVSENGLDSIRVKGEFQQRTNEIDEKAKRPRLVTLGGIIMNLADSSECGVQFDESVEQAGR